MGPISEKGKIFLCVAKSVVSDATSEANPALHFYSIVFSH